MTQFKAKSERQESVSTGLLTYPILQAADILLYDAHEVPVGEDQKQHVELCRDIAQRFNHLYGDTFQVPEPVIPPTGARIMGLDNPLAKMSKSESAARGHAIRLTDSDDDIRWAIKRAVTDSGREIVFSDDPERAGVNNLLAIYGGVTGKGRDEVLRDFADARGYGDLKSRVAEVVVAAVAPIRRRYEELMQDPERLDELLQHGAEAARAVAEPKAELVKERVGLGGTKAGVRSAEAGF
jgi:tryptophanyl-tRNA synthetase